MVPSTFHPRAELRDILADDLVQSILLTTYSCSNSAFLHSCILHLLDVSYAKWHCHKPPHTLHPQHGDMCSSLKCCTISIAFFHQQISIAKHTCLCYFEIITASTAETRQGVLSEIRELEVQVLWMFCRCKEMDRCRRACARLGKKMSGIESSGSLDQFAAV